MGKTNLEPGFRFHPTDVELVRYYLKRKVMGKKFLTNAIVELDIYKFEPPDLPEKSCQRTGDLKWYFFCPREKKYPKGGKSKRSTEYGYWKTTGKERDVSYNNEVVGKIRTLIYHFGKNHHGERTNWVMHEYRLEDKALAQKNVPQDSYVLCMLYKKNGLGPRHGDQYGAPFKEEEWWSDDEEEENTDNLAGNNDPGPSNAPKDCVNGVISESCVSDVPSDVVAYTPLLEANQEPLDDGDNNVNSLLNNFFVVNNDEFLTLEGFDNQNEVRNDETGLSVVEEDPVCLADDEFLDLDYELLINVDDLTEPSIPPAQS